MPASNPTFATTASRIVHDVLHEVAPAEAHLVGGYVEAFVELTEGGELITLDRSRGAGRFGDGALSLPVVARLVVEALRRGDASWITAQRVEEEASRLGSVVAGASAADLARALRPAIQRQLVSSREKA